MRYKTKTQYFAPAAAEPKRDTKTRYKQMLVNAVVETVVGTTAAVVATIMVAVACYVALSD